MEISTLMAKNDGKWIWYPSDFEIELANRFMERRYERDVFIPPFWTQYSCWHNVKFIKEVCLDKQETVFIKTEGKFNVEIDGAYVYNTTDKFTVDKGNHRIVVTVYNRLGLPALKLDGDSIYSDSSWSVTCNDHEFHNACYDDVLIYGDSTPNNVILPTTPLLPTKVIVKDGKTVYDFGKEIFAFVKLTNVKLSAQNITVYYGESLDEALNFDECELVTTINLEKFCDVVVTDNAKAFRYLCIEGASFSEIIALFEYLPLANSPKFSCSDDTINNIFDIALYTLSLNMREFLIDGIKRDRWVWSGDAYQGYLLNYYSYFDKAIIKRTMVSLAGKYPFRQHLNHIMDYTLFWLMGFCEYYEFTGDIDFIKANIKMAKSVIDYCLSRTNANGFLEGLHGDWVFIDWAEGLDNSGEVCFEQMLLYISLDKLSNILNLLGDSSAAQAYAKKADSLKLAIDKFWDNDKGAYIHSFKNGQPDGKVFKYANMFAILYDLCDDDKKQSIINNVLKSDKVQPITTPYMRFYELSALLKVGEIDFVLDEIKAYWGGMIEQGATSFWETFDARESGPEKYAMYGRKFGKSLCHAWGASPIYLIGRYVLGLQPLDFGNSFVLKPNLGKLENLSVEIPFSKGFLKISVDNNNLSVLSSEMNGEVVFGGKTVAVKAGELLSLSR